MLAQRVNIPMPNSGQGDQASEAYVYLFDLASQHGGQPTDRMLETILRNHALGWTAFLVEDPGTQCGMLWLTARR